MHLVAALVALAQGYDSGGVPSPEHARRALTTEDALVTIPDAGGRILLLGDLDRDGCHELAIQRDNGTERSCRIDAVSTRDGHLVGTLWHAEAWSIELTDWDVSDDIDADGAPDLVLGLGRTIEGENAAGLVIAVSGATGRQLHATGGPSPTDGFGSSVEFMGDVNGDGHADYAVGAPQCPPLQPLDEPEMELTALEARGGRAGFVSMRSGRDGAELWRVNGQRSGSAFGARLLAVGDLDGNGSCDLLVQSDPCSRQGCALLLGHTGSLRRHLPFGFEAVRRARPGVSFAGQLPDLAYESLSACGDVDGDGVADVAAFEQASWMMFDQVRFVSGRSFERLFTLSSLYLWSEYAVCVGIGDLDDDGVDDMAIGDADVDIDPKQLGRMPDLKRQSLTEALALKASGGSSFTWESGAAVVYSGKTRAPCMGVFGTPRSRDGLGLQVLSLPDTNGDGARDFLVADSASAWIFAGPGASAR